MELLSLLYQLIFMPLQIIFEVIYYLAFRVIGNPGISIIALSFIVNLLVLPLYNRADAIQEAERDMEVKLSKGVEHIKKTFKGDEQLMMLQTYYRQNGYSPLDSIKGSISLFLEIPFFVAAYQFLSHLEILNGASLGPVKDLGAPDALLSVAGMSINVLPFIMTAVNLVSAYIFTKNLTRKTKFQLYGMACFFLIFLYASPAGLVFYWTLNNIFNLVKTIICKLDDTEKGVNLAMGLCGIFIVVYSSLLSPNPNIRKTFYSAIFALLLNSRWIYGFIRSKFPTKKEIIYEAPKRNIFFAGALFLAVLVGALIPSAVIESSPQEFVIMDYFENPLWYVANSSAIAFGAFVLWGGVFYWLTPDKYKAKVERALLFSVGSSIVTYMFFGNDLGVLNSTLQYERGIKFTSLYKNINIAVILAIAFLLNILWKKYRKNISELLCIGILAMSGMVVVNVVNIQDSLDKVVTTTKAFAGKIEQGKISLSKNGKNVIVFMLDRAMGEYIPYIFNERPDLKEKFAGFTYYKNTLSHGGHTIFGSPALFGGYEYTPVEMNKRDKELLVSKHNEALKVMPVIFGEAGYDVTIFDPPMLNYQGIPDFSLYKEYPYVKGYRNRIIEEENEIGASNNADAKTVLLNNRNFYCFGIFKCAPIIMQRFLYDGGHYLSEDVLNQEITSLHTAFGTPKDFISNYKKLENLLKLTEVKESGNNFITLTNDMPHAPALLQLPGYVPETNVDNAEFEKSSIIRKDNSGNVLKISTKLQASHYHANMATMLKLAEWLDLLRKNNVYDNTRIIFVGDHGWNLRHFDNLIVEDIKDGYGDIERYYPLLFVKDFGAKELTVSNKFMTNADVPSLALEGIVAEPKNPFTGEIISTQKKMDKQFVLASDRYRVHMNTGNTFTAIKWYSVHTNILDKNNWKMEKEEAVLPY